MTNSEYFEKNQISFADAMKIFNEQKADGIRSFDEFLTSERVESRFKVGDIVVLQRDRIKICNGWKHNAVMRIVRIDKSMYWIEFLTPDGSDYIGCVRDFTMGFIDNNCIPY